MMLGRAKLGKGKLPCGEITLEGLMIVAAFTGEKKNGARIHRAPQRHDLFMRRDLFMVESP
jgi:hypothetical protein